MFIKPALGAVKLRALDTPSIQRFCNSLEERGLSPKTVKNIHGVFHKALQQAVAIGYLRTNPSNACTFTRVEKKAAQVMERDEIAEFLS